MRGLSTAHPIIARSSARPQQETERRLRAADQRPRCAGEGPEKDIYPMLPQTVAEYSPLAAVATAWAYSGSDTQQPSRMIDFIRLARASIANGLAIRCIPGARAPLPIATLSA